jgi:alpha-galactosidase
MPPLKITFIGASYLFVPPVIKDLCLSGRFGGSTAVVHDINSRPQEIVARTGRLLAEKLNAPLTVTGESSLARALDGADFIMLCITVGGKEICKKDIELCRRYGIQHVIGDTGGPAAIFRELRSVPAFLELGKLIKKHCPKAWVINFSNPMSVITSTLANYAGLNALGLCHGTHGIIRAIGRAYRAPFDRVRVRVAGVNHHAYVVSALVNGKNVMPGLVDKLSHSPAFRKATETHDEESFHFALRLAQIQGLVTNNGDRHCTEFYPYFLRTGPGGLYTAEVADYDERLKRRERQEQALEEALRTDGKSWGRNLHRYSGEDSHGIMLSLFSGDGAVHVVNAPNRGAIAGLPDEALVEVYKCVDKKGLHHEKPVTLPPHLKIKIETLAIKHRLVIEAAREKDRQKLLQALLLDPLNPEFEHLDPMVDAMLAYSKEYIRL